MQGLESDTEDEDMAEINEADLFSVLAHVEGTENEDVDKSHAPTPSEASSDERHKLENQVQKFSLKSQIPYRLALFRIPKSSWAENQPAAAIATHEAFLTSPHPYPKRPYWL